MSPRPLRILISGAGIAGPVCAYWLRRSHPQAYITIIERAPRLRKEGQTIDVAGEGREIFDNMGITETVMKSTTKEKGLDFIDSSGKVWGHFPQMDGSFTREIEIVRGELAKILYDLTKETVDYVFDDQVTGIDQSNSEDVAVTFEKDNRVEKYDMMIIADGLASRTRALAFNQDVREPVHSLHQYGAGFSFPADANHGDSDWAKWYNAPGRRVILHRPDGFGRMRSSLVHYDSTPNTRLATSSKTSVQQQKDYWAQLFKGAGWESDRLIEAMKKSDDFYAYEVAQVKIKSWSKGRVVLIGDAASCPSPISGQGTNVAITQAYVLAAMITQHPNDHTTAFRNYEGNLRTWVEGIQKISPESAPKLACPESKWGIGAFLAITWIGSLVMRSGIVKLFGKLFPSKEKGLPLPSPGLFGDTKA